MLHPKLVRDFQQKSIELDAKGRTYCYDPRCSTFIPAEHITEDNRDCLLEIVQQRGLVLSVKLQLTAVIALVTKIFSSFSRRPSMPVGMFQRRQPLAATTLRKSLFLSTILCN